MLQQWSITFLAFLSVSIVSGISLMGVFALVVRRAFLNRLIPVLVALAIGALSGDALIHLLPDAFRASDSTLRISVLVLAGFFSAFLFEYWVTQKKIKKGLEHYFLGVRPQAIINLIASSTHNFVDGALIGSAFLQSRAAGVATTIAIICHEIPHELGDFGILVGYGLRVRNAILFNCLSALIAVLGVAFTFWIESLLSGMQVWILPFTAGTFLYLAGPALMPPLLAQPRLKRDIWQLLAVLTGILLMVALKLWTG